MTTAALRLGEREIARIGLGTNRLASSPQSAALIRGAVEAGIELVDTAHTYTNGQSETAIGAALSGDLAGPVVATKGGYAPGHGRPEVLRGQIEESLRRLRTETVELYYLHRVDPRTPLEESVGELRAQRDAGRIRHVGLSAVGVEQIERALAVMPIAAVQNHYNLAERASDDVIDHCARRGIVFVAYFPLRAGHPALDGIARAHGATPAQITLAWLLQRSPALVPIPGTLSLEHVRENLAALQVELTDAEYEMLTRV